jgi:bla regulator protein blaR1
LNFSPNTHWIAAMAFERILYCLTGGMALGAVIWVVLRLLPRKNSRTQFAVWFSTLLAVALMPLFAFDSSWRSALLGGSAAPQHAVITISASWAEYIVLAWGVAALIGLSRVAAGIWQLRRLRRGCVPINAHLLSRASQARVAEVGKRRAVSVLVSSDVEVPTAIGFIHPAIIVPVWLADGTATTELEYVLLHELAHLERWDDWSNLVQKLIKSFLFFHPAVWWIERKLSLDREMACDDAVLAQSVSPRIYAQCLARVAEKRFLQRQMALAQAAVDRMKQLSRRVARILDTNRASSTRLWKPAVPMVLGAAAICAVSTLRTTELVRFTEPQPATSALASSNLQIPLKAGGGDQLVSAELVTTSNAAKVAPAHAADPAQARAWPASLKTNRSPSLLLPAKHQAPQHKPSPALRAAYTAPEAADPLLLSKSDDGVTKQSEEVPVESIVLVVATQRIVSTNSGTWQFSTWELRLVVPASHPAKPIPRKS